MEALQFKQHGLERAKVRPVLAVAPTPNGAARLSPAQLRSALKRAGCSCGIEEEAQRLRDVFRGDWHAQAQRHLFNRMLGQLFHCL